MADYRTSVLVIGGGPVGLATSMELSHHGVTSIVVEPRAEVSAIRPRAKTTNARTMELFRRWGFADTIRRDAPMHVDWSKDIIFCTSLTGREVTRITGVLGLSLVDHELVAEAGQQVPQPVVERAMRQAIDASDTASLLLGWRATSIDEGDDTVVVTIENAAGEVSTVEADYVVGADGPRSVTRTAIGAEYVGADLAIQNVSITFESSVLGDLVPHGNGVQYWIVNPASPGLIGRLDLDDQWWAISTARPTQQDTAPDPEAVVKELIGADIPLRIIATDPWQARALIADRYRRGRVFLVGDAAHQNPPWGGHGYNTGVGDAVNLGWKLAAVVNGWAPSTLLDSYEAERRPVAETFVNAAAENARAGVMTLGSDAIMGDDEQFALAQPGMAEAIQAAKRMEFHSDGLILGLGYDGHGLEQTTTGQDYTPVAASGNRLPHRWIAPGDSLYDHLGREFTVIGAASDTAAFAAAAASLGVPLTTLDPTALGIDGFGAEITLVRPDQYIAWIGTPINDTSPTSILEHAINGFRSTVHT